MDAMYANQMTVSIGQDEVVLHFSFIAPNYDEKGDVLEKPSVASERTIILTKLGFEKFAGAIMNVVNQPKE